MTTAIPDSRHSFFSRRWHESYSLNPLTRELQSQGKDVLDLTETNPTKVGLFAGATIPGEVNPVDETYDPDPRGIPTAREAVAAYYRERGETVSAANVLVTSSTSEAYAFLFKLLCDPGDDVLIPNPGYPLFADLARMENASVRYYPIVWDPAGRWRIDLDALMRETGASTRAVLVINPHNPTGMLLEPDEQEKLIAHCASSRTALIADEVFIDYPYRKDPATSLAAADRCLTFTLNGLSKLLGLPQVKLSWICVSGPGQSQALEHLGFLGDLYLNVNSAVQHRLPYLLAGRSNRQQEIRRRIAANRATLEEAGDLAVAPLGGGWSQVLFLPESTDDENFALSLLRNQHVLVHPGYLFGLEPLQCLVLSLIVHETIFTEGVQRLAHELSRW